jgi:hypothetical protein
MKMNSFDVNLIPANDKMYAVGGIDLSGRILNSETYNVEL